MRYTKITVAVAAAGAGVICLAPTAAADDSAAEPDTATRASEVEPRSIRGIIPCVRVGSVRGIIPCIRVRSERGIIPCVRVGVPVVPEGRLVDTNPPDPVRAGDGSVAVD